VNRDSFKAFTNLIDSLSPEERSAWLKFLEEKYDEDRSENKELLQALRRVEPEAE